MELWRELLISGLQNESNIITFVDDNILKIIIEKTCYKVLLQIKQFINNKNFSDKDCFIKIEEILHILETNNILCDRHDFG